MIDTEEYTSYALSLSACAGNTKAL
jgi:hypothetical protein